MHDKSQLKLCLEALPLPYDIDYSVSYFEIERNLQLCFPIEKFS